LGIAGRRHGGLAQHHRHQNPAIDKLIERVIFNKDRADLVAANQGARSRAMWNHYVGAAVELSETRTARWDRFGRRLNAKYGLSGFPALWWFDAERAARIGKRS